MIYNCELVVAVRLPDGSIDSRYVQPLNEFLYEEPSTEVVRSARGTELLDLLANDLGIVSIDSNKLKLNYVRPGQRKEVRPEAMRLLGRLAEVLIVRQCNQDKEKNKLWASYAIRHTLGRLPDFDKYQAIGTSFTSTKYNPDYRTKYSPTDTQRDILWINRNNPRKELLRAISGSSGYLAGLQVKVSRNKKTVLETLRNKEYGVPVVYFDLNRDFEWVAEKLRRDTEIFQKRRWEIGVDLICGRSVAPELHDTLLQFLPLLDGLLSGSLELSDLLQELPEVGTAVTARFVEKTGLDIQFYQQQFQTPIPVLTLPI